MNPTGTWRVNAAGPFGDFTFDIDIAGDEQAVTAVARFGDRQMQIDGLHVSPDGDGYRVRWSQQMASLMRMRVKVDAKVQGERLTGTAKAGLLPASRLEGYRLG